MSIWLTRWVNRKPGFRGWILTVGSSFSLPVLPFGSTVPRSLPTPGRWRTGDAVRPSEIAGDVLTDTGRGKNGLVGQLRQSVFGRLGGDDDVNDADRLGLDAHPLLDAAPESDPKDGDPA